MFSPRDANAPAEFYIDSTGKVVVQYWYDAWGNPKVVDGNGNEITDQTHIGNVNPFRYRGYYFDVETGLYYLQTRYYDPTTGRFLNRDSIAYADPESIHGLNLYAYCLNNPIKYADPDGTFILLILGLALSFTVGFAASAISQGIQYGWQNINWWQSAVDGLFAVASTALAATGICLAFSVGIGAVSGFSQYAIDSAFHGEALTWGGAITATILGAVAGAISGAGASNGKVLADNMSGRAASGMKALITTINKYGINSSAYKSVMNLYGKAISTAVQNIVNQQFTKSALAIWGSTILSPAMQYLGSTLFQLAGI